MKKILILDNNKDILNSLDLALRFRLKGHQILTATNGDKGSNILKETPVDVILTDLDMPRINGDRFIEQTRREYPNVPVYVMAGRYTPDCAERLHALGIRMIIKKPFLFDHLAELISNELGVATSGHA